MPQPFHRHRALSLGRDDPGPIALDIAARGPYLCSSMTPARPSSLRPQTLPPPGAWAPARQALRIVARPVEQFLRIQAASGVLLLACAVVAMVWANSPWQASYHALWHTHVVFGVGSWHVEPTLHFLVNDGLMTLFFFVVGLEIRRELHHGELSDLRRAALPAAAALGGMVVPALVFLSLNAGTAAAGGWGVPMATDIAFAVGILALLGPRVPAALRILLLALAIIDDIGAILVIAIFYSSGGDPWLGGGLVTLALLAVVLLQRLGVRSPAAYVAPALALWAGFLLLGVHPTIAGVILGLLTPARAWYGAEGFLEEANEAIQEFRAAANRPGHDAHDLVHALDRLGQARVEALAPVERFEVALNPWVAFGIMPLFALANAGVSLAGLDLGAEVAPALGLGVALGLALGKPIGIVGASFLAVRSGLCSLPKGVDLRGLTVVGLLGGIGFTMALFIGALAFTDDGLLGITKLAVLVGSALAGVLGLVLGWMLLPHAPLEGVATSAAEAERETHR
jgi:NhaA family Na+:H+ antiporter